MNLIEVYINEVTQRLPEKNRDDIALELHSTIHDMLPDKPSENEVKEVLATLGSPVKLASSYRDRPAYLIGPVFYDQYLSILKMSLPIAFLVVAVTQVIGLISEYSGENNFISLTLAVVFNIIGASINVGIHVFFWITIVFIFLERFTPVKEYQMQAGDSWDPGELKNIISIPKRKTISKTQVYLSFLWTAIWSGIYFNATNIMAVYESSDRTDGLTYITPVFNEALLLSFWPFVTIFIAIEIALAIYKWVLGQWTKRLALINTIYQASFLGLFIVIASQPNLFNPDFIAYQADLFNSTEAVVVQILFWIIWGSILVTIITSAFDAFDGFRKAKLKSEQILN